LELEAEKNQIQIDAEELLRERQEEEEKARKALLEEANMKLDAQGR
jgi:hypothetical protein